VLQWSDASFIEDQDHWWQAGIQREVFLYSTMTPHLQDVFARGDLAANLKDGMLRVTCSIWFLGERHRDCTVEAQLFDARKKRVFVKPVKTTTAELHGPHTLVTFEREVKRPALWSAESPSLYTLVVTPAANSTANIEVDVAAGVAVDANNNPNAAASAVQAVDTTALSLAITDDEPGVANIAGGDVTFTFTFSEAVTGFATMLRDNDYITYVWNHIYLKKDNATYETARPVSGRRTSDVASPTTAARPRRPPARTADATIGASPTPRPPAPRAAAIGPRRAGVPTTSVLMTRSAPTTARTGTTAMIAARAAARRNTGAGDAWPRSSSSTTSPATARPSRSS
jgi:hypothetical protein